MPRRLALPPLVILMAWLAARLAAGAGSAASPPSPADWPMWGGTPGRNLVSPATGLPASFDVATGRNVRWSSALGTQAYGNPVVAGGKVFVGTNNEAPRDPAVRGDRGVLMAFRADDGAFLWQAVSEKLDTARDWPLTGVSSSPLVDALAEGDRLYYLTNRGELAALDAEGFADGENDGPFQAEARTTPADADLVWRLDLRAELGVVPRFATASSPAAWGGLLFLHTGNGPGEGGRVPAPKAPSFLAVDQKTGKVAWADASPGEGLLGGQWSSPAVGPVGGIVQAVFAGGDGKVYGFEAATGKRLWSFDGNAGMSGAPDAKPAPPAVPKAGPGFFVATPVLHDGRVYVGLGQDPQEGAAPGRFWAIDATRRGDLTKDGALWRYDGLARTLSTAAVDGGLVYVADFRGFLHCLDAATGRPYWTYDAFAAVWGSPLVADGKVYLMDEDGDIAVLRTGRKLEVLAEINLGAAAYGTPVPAGGALYVATARRLFKFAVPGKPESQAIKR